MQWHFFLECINMLKQRKGCHGTVNALFFLCVKQTAKKNQATLQLHSNSFNYQMFYVLTLKLFKQIVFKFFIKI